MASSISPPSITDPQRWLNQFTKTFESHLLVDSDLPISIFKLPQTLISENPQSYLPQNIGLGPIHHFHPDLYTKQQQLKLVTAKKTLKPYKITSDFQNLVVINLKELIPEARCCYDIYFDLDDNALAWVFAIDSLFLLDIFTKITEENQFFEDVIMVENQIPLIVLIEVQSALDEHLSGDSDNSVLSNLIIKICEIWSPVKFSRRITRLDLDVTSRVHLLDCLYYLIVNDYHDENMFRRANFFENINVEDVENAVQMASDLCPGASAFLQPVLLLFKLPWDKILDFVKRFMGEKPEVLEIDIPSASQLSSVAKIEFRVIQGGVRAVKFDEKTNVFYLPIMNLKSDSEVILRNLVAYEGSMVKNGNFGRLEFREYLDVMCGIIDSVKDVRILRDKNIIEGDLGDEEIAKFFNGISKSSMKMDENSELGKTVARINKRFGSMPRVKVYNFLKKHIIGSWKIFVIAFTLLNLLLLIFQGVCHVYECGHRLGLDNLRGIFGYAAKNNQVFNF